MKNILVLGAEGMLGSQLTNYFKNQNNVNLYFTSRRKVKNTKSIFFDVMKNEIEDLLKISNFDFIINCIGVIKPLINKNLYHSIYINSLFPIKLSDFCELKKINLIHITTDCVFSGLKGFYDESDIHDALDIYGKSKSLGEAPNCMVIRTSIIGQEIKNSRSLISWIISKKNNEINGFANHFWNGLTTNYLSEVIYKIIFDNYFKKKIFHIYSPNDVSKYDLVKLINNKFFLNIKINKINSDSQIDRRLSSIYDLSKNLATKSIEEQIKELN